MVITSSHPASSSHLLALHVAYRRQLVFEHLRAAGRRKKVDQSVPARPLSGGTTARPPAGGSLWRPLRSLTSSITSGGPACRATARPPAVSSWNAFSAAGTAPPLRPWCAA